MQLWSGTLSPFSAKVRMALAEMQLDYELLDLPWNPQTRWEPKPAAFLQASLRGEVPVLLADGLQINDSTVIIEYLCDAFPAHTLLPSNPRDRARARLLEDQADHCLSGAVVVLISEVFLKPDGSGRDTTAVAAAQQELRDYQQRLEQALDDADYLAPLPNCTMETGLSSADIATFVTLGFAQTLGAGLESDCVRLQAWWQRLLARPALGQDFGHMMQAIAALPPAPTT
ncbi:MAG: glutathione S-transferase family protein [Pseudomonadales bacterium]